MSPSVSQLDESSLEGLKARLVEAQEHGLALSVEDKTLLVDALHTLAYLQERLTDKDITLHKLRKLLGLERSSEKLSDLTALSTLEDPAPQKAAAPSPSASRQPPQKHAPRVKPAIEHHALQDLGKGDACPGCDAGKCYKYEPARLLRITGSTPYQPTLHLSERLRCNACGAFFTAPLPAAVKADGEPNQKYGYSARTLIALSKYFGGTPFYRQASLQDMLGMPMSASTAFDQCEQLANACQPVFQLFRRLAGDAQHFHIDDTSNRILSQQPVLKKKRNSDTTQLRTGIYSSGLIAQLANHHQLILFNTNIGHAGEFIDEILRYRSPGMPPPLIMSDALTHNWATVTPTVQTLCNAHGRRQFVDVMHHFPQEVKDLLECYGEIWKHETTVTTRQLSPAQRLAYHREHSLPIMEAIRSWGQTQFDQQRVEENSGLGKAIRYLDKHFEGLTAFCRYEGAQLDNNLMEQQLKLVVRNRKNASFFKSPVGAAVGDVITSVIATATQAGVNVFDYLNALQRNQHLVKSDPLPWLPWHFESRLN